MLIILSGKTASGKDTIAKTLLIKLPNLKKIITTTSRQPRAGEKIGVDYFFISSEDFEKKIALDDFTEWVKYGGNYYGTDKSALKNADTQDLLWKIDPSMAGKAKEILSNRFPLIVFYINSESEEILNRLKQRRLSEEEIKLRLQDDDAIWQKYNKNYDYVIENKKGELDNTIEAIVKIISQK